MPSKKANGSNFLMAKQEEEAKKAEEKKKAEEELAKKKVKEGSKGKI